MMIRTERDRLALEGDETRGAPFPPGSVCGVLPISYLLRRAFARLSTRSLCSEESPCAIPSCSRISTPFFFFFFFNQTSTTTTTIESFSALLQ